MSERQEDTPTVQLALEDMMPLIREQLAAGKRVRFTPYGNSMWPMLRSGRDMVELSALPQQLKKYDLPLYQRHDGNYILHRIIRVEPDGCTCAGDRQMQYETGLHRDRMIALVTAFCRNGRWYSVTHPLYRLYCRLWPMCRLALRCLKKIGHALLRLRARLHGQNKNEEQKP